MDSTLIIWIFCIIGAIIGLKGSLSSMIIFCWNIVFSLYLSIWTYAFVDSFLSSFPKNLTEWKPAIIVAVLTVVVMGVLSAVKKGILKDSELDVDFPVIGKYVGGLFFGGVSGSLLAILLLVIFGLSPYSNIAGKEFEENNYQVTTSSVISFTNIVNGFSFQPNVNEHQIKFLNDLLMPKVVSEEESIEEADKLLDDKTQLPVK